MSPAGHFLKDFSMLLLHRYLSDDDDTKQYVTKRYNKATGQSHIDTFQSGALHIGTFQNDLLRNGTALRNGTLLITVRYQNGTVTKRYMLQNGTLLPSGTL